MHESKATGNPIIDFLSIDLGVWQVSAVSGLGLIAKGLLVELMISRLGSHRANVAKEPQFTTRLGHDIRTVRFGLEDLKDHGVIDDYSFDHHGLVTTRFIKRVWHKSTDVIDGFKRSRRGYVYLIESKREGVSEYKIGRTTNVPSRLRAIGTKMPVPVELVHHFECDDAADAERCLHAVLDQYRLNGEWFALPPHIVDSLCDVMRYHDSMFDASRGWAGPERKTQFVDVCEDASYASQTLFSRYAA